MTATLEQEIRGGDVRAVEGEPRAAICHIYTVDETGHTQLVLASAYGYLQVTTCK